MSDIIQQMYDSFPEEEELKDFDSFFIGDGSRSLMSKRSDKINTNSQLMGISSITDLLNNNKEVSYDDCLVDDTESFIPELVVDEPVEPYFCRIKKEVFDSFGFLEIKSKRLEGRPFREIDLLISGDDKYLLNYLQSVGIEDYGVYNAIAQLKALSEMGFTEVRFVQKDCCPICESYDGYVYSLDVALSIVCSGKHLIHRNCICKFIPVIRDRDSCNSLFKVDLPEVYVGDSLVENLPLEYECELYSLIPSLNCSKVVFVSMKDLSELVGSNSLVMKKDDTIYVCVDYLGNYSLLDYLTNWLNLVEADIDVTEEIDNKISSGDIYYLNGQKVVEVEGIYFNIDTRERVE